jgi:hypothetical protein
MTLYFEQDKYYSPDESTLKVEPGPNGMLFLTIGKPGELDTDSRRFIALSAAEALTLARCIPAMTTPSIP